MPSSSPHVLVVEARYYTDICDALLQGATDALREGGATFEVVSVPGALEIPAAVAFALASPKAYDGFVALGCIIRGETYHFDIVANESSRALMDLAVSKRLAVGNAILTPENEAQAWARARKTEGDVGGFAAKAALRMIALKREWGV